MLCVLLLLALISEDKVQSVILPNKPPTVCAGGHGQPCKAKYTYTYKGVTLNFTNNNICTCSNRPCSAGWQSPNYVYKASIKEEFATYSGVFVFCESVKLPMCSLGRKAVTLSSSLQSWNIHSLHCKCRVGNFLYKIRREDYPNITKYIFACDSHRDFCGPGSICSITLSDHLISLTSTSSLCECPVGTVCQRGPTAAGRCLNIA